MERRIKLHRLDRHGNKNVAHKDTFFQDSPADWSEGLFTHTGTAVFCSINCYVIVCTLSIGLNIEG